MGSTTTYWCDECGKTIEGEDCWGVSYEIEHGNGYEPTKRGAIFLCGACKFTLVALLSPLFVGKYREAQ